MSLKDLYQQVEFRHRIKLFDDLDLIKNCYFKKYSCPEVEVKNYYEFEIIEQFILNHDKIENKDECLLISKDLLAYLKTEDLKFGRYFVTKNNDPILCIVIGGRFRSKQIEINDYIYALETETTIGAKLINFLFNL